MKNKRRKSGVATISYYQQREIPKFPLKPPSYTIESEEKPTSGSICKPTTAE
jgi:hypothetical protein